MSDLSLNLAPTPELLNAAYTQTAGPLTGAGAAGPNRPGADAPAEGSSPGSPFAALLSGVLQGAQPRTPAAGPSDPGSGGPPPLEAQSEDGTDAVALLALPGIAMPLPETPGGPADPGGLFGKTLPVSGNPLPLDPAAGLQARVPVSGPTTDRGAIPDGEAVSPPPTAVTGDKRPQISLADLALSRPLELAAAGGDAAGRVSTDPMAMALAGRSLARRDARASQAESAALLLPPSATTESATGIPGAAPTVAGAGKISLRLTAADLLRGALVPAASSDGIANQIAVQSAAFAAASDSGTALAGAAPAAGSAVPDSGSSAALLARLGNMTLAPLQPHGDAGAFAVGLADRLLTLGGPGSHSARLKLHPEHLGELDVEISMDDGVAQVWFGTTTSQARDAIESSLPRLRELFAEQGIHLTRTHIDASGAQMSNAGSGQQRHMKSGGYGTEVAAWQSAAIRGRGGADAIPNSAPAESASARLLDVWA